ncbi:copper homeostasis membrane protein CopD [Bordetella sp. FB-8]|uniref:copper homeostasis membrane protein CopD n=1 Tax=Bordetella sp. FB-8 TaxID=1159870 RepID=UPI00035F7E69|nr:copper homeostasis membrane protein CopD [Bordetella sp. FB-8]
MLAAANVACRFVSTLAPMLVFGASLMLAASGNAQAARRLNARLRPLLRVLATAGLPASWLLLSLEAALVTDSRAAMHNLATLQQVALLTDYGHACLVQGIAALALCTALWLPGQRPPALLACLSACVLAGIGINGHAAMDEGLLGLAHMANNVAHILCSAFWIGALLVVLPLLCSWPDEQYDAGPIMVRFSTLGHIAVAGSILTGVLDTWLILRGSGLNPHSRYQQWLALKIAVVLGMAVLALSNRYYWVPRLSGEPYALHALRRQAAYSVAAGSIAVLIVALFGTLPPA